MDQTAAKITNDHLRRDAYLYVRQSTLRQVITNTESTQRQYVVGRRVRLGICRRGAVPAAGLLALPGAVGGLRGRQRREQPVGSDPIREPVGLQRLEDVVLDPGDGEHHAPVDELRADLLDGVHRGDVDVDVRLDVQHEPVQSGDVRVGCGKRPLAEVAGVREVQRRVVPIHEQPGSHSRVRVVVDVVNAGNPLDVALARVVRPGDPAQRLGAGDDDGRSRSP
jgi:hypothetical protein